ncbi:MAG: DUF2490 domain-containing protein [Nitrospira sp.]|nr:DUF2490 domain-containing protein [Nitrospira sp.]
MPMERMGVGQRHRHAVHMVWIVTLWVLIVLGAPPAQAYTELGPNTKSDFRLWTPVYLTVKLPASFLAYMEVNPRFADDVTNLDQLLLRPAIGYQLTEHVSIWQGYAWVGNYNQPAGPRFFEENRIYQQVNYLHKFSHLKFLSRTRLEERWIEHADGTAVRFRQMFRADVPIPQAPTWAVVMYDEVFVNLNTVGTVTSKGPEAGLDQNRFFLGINKTFNQHVNVDLGYQNQMINNRKLEGNANLINHMLLLQLWINL